MQLHHGTKLRWSSRLFGSLIATVLIVGILAGPALAMVAPVVTLTGTTNTTASITWTDAGDEQRYELFLNNVFLAKQGSSQHSFTYSSLTACTTYALRVDAVKSRTRLSSNTVNATTTGCGNPPPTVTSFSPTSGVVGTAVTVTGTNFTGATATKFNGTSATFTVTDSTHIATSVPTGATTGPISVTTPSGTGTSSTNFTVTTPPAPTVTGFTPTSGAVGTGVSVTGTSFTGATAVKFNGTTATFTVTSDTAISTTVPSGATTGPISVTTPNGTGTSATNFTVTTGGSPPTVGTYAPGSGLTGIRIVVTGTGFTGASSVTFNGTPVSSFTVISPTRIDTTVPTGATTGLIAVTTSGGTGSSSTSFSVLSLPSYSCSGVSVSPITGDNVAYLQGILNGQPQGTTFCFQPGTYELHGTVGVMNAGYVFPRTGDRLICVQRRQCIITGLDTYQGGIRGVSNDPNTNDVTIQGFLFTHFLYDSTLACCRSPFGGSGWQILDNESSFNSVWGGGMGCGYVTDNGVVQFNYIHDNGWGGLLNGPCALGPLVENNEIANNNPTDTNLADTGGIVIKGSTGNDNSDIKDNYVHGNGGQGIWNDGLTTHPVIHGNLIENNIEQGIFYEISETATIRDNVVMHDQSSIGTNTSPSCYQAEIQLRESSGTEVASNYVEDVATDNGDGGICVAGGSRHAATNNNIHDNVVKMRPYVGQTVGPFSGVTNYDAMTPFTNNTYYVEDVTKRRWQFTATACPTGPSQCTWTEWQAAGNDLTGSVAVW